MSELRGAGLDRLDMGLLARTLELAECGRPAARPNPVVGALLATPDGTVLAEGFHARDGGVHAERAALQTITGEVPRDATLYVSLEPCSHHGRQPPCTDAILQAGVRRVVIAGADSNPETAGIGPGRLEAAGVEVRWAPRPLAARAAQQNAGFHQLHQQGRPYVTYKWAMTRNRRMSTGRADPWISSPESRGLVHYMRAGSGAVAVGIGTVLADDPQLTVRGALAARVAQPPLRVVYDRELRMPLESRLVATAGEGPLLVMAAEHASESRSEALTQRGVEVWRAPSGESMLAASLSELGRRRVADLLLESGPTLAGAFHRAGLLDVLYCFRAGFDGPPEAPGFEADDPVIEALSQPSAMSSSGGDLVLMRVLHAAGLPSLPAE